MLDPQAIRRYFPSLQRLHGGQPVVYFDNPAGTQVPQHTIDGYRIYLEESNSNTGGYFDTSQATDSLIAAAREAMVDLLGAASPDEIIFGQNMTTLAFSLSHALGRMLQPGDEIVTTRLEHDANIAPWLALQDQGITLRWIDIHPEDVTLDLESAARVISRRTRLVAVGYASNAFGTINQVRRIADMAHDVGAWVFVDAVHYGPHGFIDRAEIRADLLACSPYKFFGPHLGVLCGRYEVLSTLRADHVRPSGDIPPGSWETGTLNHEALAALVGMISYLESLSEEGVDGRRARLRSAMRRIKAYERTLSERLIAGLHAMEEVQVYGITNPADFDRRVPTVSFTVQGRRPEEVAERLGEQGIYSWAGDHYAVEPLSRLRLESTVRIGLVHYNTMDEIDRFLAALAEIIRESPPAS